MHATLKQNAQTAQVSRSRGEGVLDCPDNHHYRYVWSAAELQAENQDDGLVCTNVFGLWWSSRLLAMMDSARSLPH
jgi:hypothetical protein